ncbi:SecDF P1 head subdomain-containing protein [Actinokineospora sp. NPDC004072]
MARALGAVLVACVVLSGCQSAVGGEAVQAPSLDFRPVVVAAPVAGLTPGVTTPACPDRSAAQDAACVQAPELATDPTAQLAAMNALDCGAGPADADPDRPLAACARDGAEVFVLGAVLLDERHVAGATAAADPQGVGYVVTLSFTAEGADIWARHTGANVGQRVAFLVDGEVVSAPSIQGEIRGDTTIHGGAGGFSEEEAEALAASLG